MCHEEVKGIEGGWVMKKVECQRLITDQECLVDEGG